LLSKEYLRKVGVDWKKCSEPPEIHHYYYSSLETFCVTPVASKLPLLYASSRHTLWEASWVRCLVLAPVFLSHRKNARCFARKAALPMEVDPLGKDEWKLVVLMLKWKEE
jgi:hypothetical protein